MISAVSDRVFKRCSNAGPNNWRLVSVNSSFANYVKSGLIFWSTGSLRLQAMWVETSRHAYCVLYTCHKHRYAFFIQLNYTVFFHGVKRGQKIFVNCGQRPSISRTLSRNLFNGLTGAKGLNKWIEMLIERWYVQAINIWTKESFNQASWLNSSQASQR